MKKDKRTNRDFLVCIEGKVIQHGKDIHSLKQHFENHLTEHKEDLKDKLKYNLRVKLVVLTAALAAAGSLIVGLLLLFAK